MRSGTRALLRQVDGQVDGQVEVAPSLAARDVYIVSGVPGHAGGRVPHLPVEPPARGIAP
jgi:hypothetical protein